MLLQYISVFFLLGLAMYLSVKKNKITENGALAGGALGLAIFQGAGFTGLAMLALFFVVGTAVTAWQQSYKTRLGLAEENKGRRTAWQAGANAGVAAMLGVVAWLWPALAEMAHLMVAAAFAAATADTVSSELGNVYGQRFYNIITLKPDIRGRDGVISREGTLLGVLGSSLIALLYGFGFGWNANLLIIILAGTLGNLLDSVMGATWERRRYLTNNAVNFLNTAAGASAAGLLHWLF